jgi:hypothetical protein
MTIFMAGHDGTCRFYISFIVPLRVLRSERSFPKKIECHLKGAKVDEQSIVGKRTEMLQDLQANGSIFNVLIFGRAASVG